MNRVNRIACIYVSGTSVQGTVTSVCKMMS